MTRVLPRPFYDRPVLDVAPDLLGKLIVRREDDGSETTVRLVETEAYHESDPASHSYRGPTPRNAVMFGPGGHLYVYFTYGMHFCMNVSCGPEGTGAAVLLRAAAPVTGLDTIRSRRGPKPSDRDLLRGPARLTSGLGIDRPWDGTDVTDPTSPLRIEDDGAEVGEIGRGPRVGIRQAVDQPWRFWIADHPAVSPYTRHPRAQG